MLSVHNDTFDENICIYKRGLASWMNAMAMDMRELIIAIVLFDFRLAAACWCRAD